MLRNGAKTPPLILQPQPQQKVPLRTLRRWTRNINRYFFPILPLFLAEMEYFLDFGIFFLAFQHFLKGGGFSGREMELKPPPLFLEPKIRIFDREGGGVIARISVVLFCVSPGAFDLSLI